MEMIKAFRLEDKQQAVAQIIRAMEVCYLHNIIPSFIVMSDVTLQHVIESVTQLADYELVITTEKCEKMHDCVKNENVTVCGLRIMLNENVKLHDFVIAEYDYETDIQCSTVDIHLLDSKLCKELNISQPNLN